jgi:hypothetical protein
MCKNSVKLISNITSLFNWFRIIRWFLWKFKFCISIKLISIKNHINQILQQFSTQKKIDFIFRSMWRFTKAYVEITFISKKKLSSLKLNSWFNWDETWNLYFNDRNCKLTAISEFCWSNFISSNWNRSCVITISIIDEDWSCISWIW